MDALARIETDRDVLTFDFFDLAHGSPYRIDYPERLR
jgi:hypothetical protein